MTRRRTGTPTVRIATRGLTAVLLAVLIVAGTVSPAVGMAFTDSGALNAAGNESGAGDLGAIVESDEAERLTNDSATLQRTWARTLLLNLQNTETTGDYGSALEDVNQSLATAVGPSVVANESAFRNDAAAVDALELAGSHDERKQTVLAAHLLASADNETASAQVSYAKWALNRTESRLSTGGRRSAEAHIRNAERALDRGQERLASGDATDLDSRVAAIEQFRVAWVQATLALERIDAETDPRVTITTRGDPLRNGTQELTGEIRGEVFDVRPRGLTNATVSVEDGPTVTVPVTVENRRANATFAANVTLEDRVTAVTATVSETGDNRPGLGEDDETGTATDRQSTPATTTDAKAGGKRNGGPGKAKAKQKGGPGKAEEARNPGKAKGKQNGGSGKAKAKQKGGPGKAEESEKGSPGEARQNGGGPPTDRPAASGDRGSPFADGTDSDTVLFDGDGLPDRFEVEVVGTDPQDPDSDSPAVEADVGDNGVVDGLEDFDDDNVTNYFEGRFGTDPFAADTDDDSLPDIFEIENGKLDPTDEDSDDDGVTDPAWDIDGDGLTNLEEYEAGTNPQIADIDRDGLNDAEELEAGTNASDPDTDDDGLLDGEELRLGTDPLDPDSDGDGTADGEASYTTTASNESLGVSVSLSGSGDVASGVTVEDGSDPAFDREQVTDAQVTSFVNLESEREFDSANVSFSYNDSQLGSTNESDLVVFRYNETLNLFEPLETTVDETNNTVTGETEHFSRFVVFDVRNWAANYDAERPTDGTADDEIQPLDVVFIIDSSGSMAWNDPEEFRKTAAKEFVGALVEGDRAGVVDFDSNAFVSQELTTDFGAVNASIERLDASGGTDIGDGVRQANRHFAEKSNSSRAKFAILLTDGQGSGGRAEAQTAAERGTTIYTIGFGGANGNKLQDIAQTTGGNYSYVANPSDLPQVFSRVADDIGAQDTDGDGLPDVAERRGVPTSQGLIQTNPYDNDTDGDGISDRVELGRSTSFSELRERQNGTVEANATEQAQADAIVSTMEAAGYNLNNVSTKIFLQPDSDPSKNDTDGDGIDDGTETTEPATVLYTPTKEDSLNVLESGEPDASVIENSYERNEVYSDPWQSDTDGDGLNDSRERELATNPRSADTDGDGIDDATEQAGRGDPTLYDVRGPSIAIETSGYSVPETSLDTTYWVGVDITDAAGVESTSFVKNGNVEQTRTYDSDDPYLTDGGTRVIGTLEWTDPAVSTEEVDTSSVESTFVSFGSAAVDAVGDATDTVGDVTVGTTVYLRATDANDNSEQAVGVQRENFYGAVAGDLYTGTIFDQAVASEFGKLSGFSASLGVIFNDISTFIDDPTAFIDGIQALYSVIQEEGLDVVQPLIDGYIQQFERKQAQNNPYGGLEEQEYPELYSTFEANWYQGYVAGFLTKIVISAGAGSAAKNAIKQTDTASDIARQLADTRALRALSRIQGASDAAKARVTARILLASDDATEAVVSQADTAGQAVRLWRIQRNIDADVDALPEAQQANLGDVLVRADADSRDAIRRMDQDALDDFTGLDVDPRVRAGLAQKYADLDADQRRQLTNAISDDPAAARTVSTLDSEGVSDALDYFCGGSLSVMGAPGGLGSDRHYAVQPALVDGCTVQTDFRSPMWRVDADVRDSLDDRLDSDQFRRLVQSDIGTDGLESVDDLDTITSVQRVDGDLVISGEKAGIDTELSYPDDRAGFYTRNSDSSIEDIRGMTSQQIGADVVEEDIAPAIIRQRDGWDVVYAEQKGGTDAGIDLIARNADGEYVITEVKFTRSSSTPGKSYLDSERELDDGTEARQMEDEWISDSFDEEIEDGSFEDYSAVEDAIDLQNYEKEVIVVQDGAASRSIVGSFDDFDIDDVTIVRTQGVTGEGP